MKRIIEIRPAEGGEDAALFAQDLLTAYRRLADRLGWKHQSNGLLALAIDGPDLTSLDRHEPGGHRVQRVPPTERRGRVHTSTVTVAILGRPEAVCNLPPRSDQVLRAGQDYSVEWYSGSGAGGQHRNKHQNCCRIRHLASGLIRKAECRSREASYREALTALQRALGARAIDRQHRAENTARRGQIGSGMRGDKRRTYRFQDDSVVDHVTGRQCRASDVMRGGFDKLWK